MRRSLFVGILWIIFSVSAIAQGDWDSLCAHVHETGSVTVRGFAFKTYDATNPGDSACLGIFRDGKIMFLMAEDQKQYNLGQPGDARFKIPPVPNGVDLTGEGRPDMIVSSWSGGAHCCFNHFIFELEPKLRVLATIKDGDIDLAHFEKLGQDSGYRQVERDVTPHDNLAGRRDRGTQQPVEEPESYSKKENQRSFHSGDARSLSSCARD
jgi:hypothetical protein